jgi:hypothetical protein
MPQLTAEQVEQQLRGLNRKNVQRVPDVMRRIAAEKSFHIYNVGPYTWLRHMGSMGAWTIQKADPETGISPALKVPALVFETVPTDMDKMEERSHDGRDFVNDLLGVGKFKTPDQDLTRWGVFFTEGTEPTEAEIEKAHLQVLDRCRDMINQADGFEAQGPNQLINITEQHRWAAKMLNVERPWSKETRAMIDCPGCGEKILPTVAVHGGRIGCGAILDRERAEELGLVEKKAKASK